MTRQTCWLLAQPVSRQRASIDVLQIQGLGTVAPMQALAVGARVRACAANWCDATLTAARRPPVVAPAIVGDQQ
jgi:hypothetical protein